MSNAPIPTLRLSMRTITPVSIGSDKGDQLSPYADYIFSEDGKQLHYLNLRAIERAFEAPGMQQQLDEYVHGIRTGMDNNRSDFDLRRFVTGSLKQDLGAVTRRMVAQYGLKPGDRRNVMAAIKNAGQLYVPGSSIKGALRTAMLYDWLVNTKAGEPELKRCAFLIGQYAEKKNEQATLRKRSNDPDARRRARDMQKELQRLEDDIFNEDKLFGKLNDRNNPNHRGPDARHIRVSDTRAIDLSPEVYSLRRIRIVPGQGKSVIPQVVEAIPAGTDLTFSLDIVPQIGSPVLEYWNKGDFSEIFSLLNGFSKACIDNELYELRDALDSSETPLPHEKEIGDLIEFYEGLEKRVSNGEILLRIGFGKTVHDNSLLLALLNGLEDEQKAWQQFRQAFHKVGRRNAFFPVTRTLTPGGAPMGWVKVTKQE